MAKEELPHDAHPDHAHGHGPDDGPERYADPGGEHLAAALRTSFRLLGAIMVLGVGAFLAMGFQFVRPGEVAIRTVFGKVVGTTPEGLAYNWPAPIGRIEKVSVGERTIRIDDFWMNETREDQLQPTLRKRAIPKGGLRPGWDGALLTGDRNLLHMRLKCTYALRRLWDPAREIDPVLRFRQSISDANETMRSVLCDAAIRAAALRTADGLQRTERAAFEDDVRKAAQKSLDAIPSGIGVRTVKVVNSTWPLRALPDYDAAMQAISEAETLKSKARQVAVGVLNATAGPVAAQKLVGTLEDVVSPSSAGAAPSEPGGKIAERDLIGQYNEAVRLGRTERVGQLIDRIENLLVSDELQGQARRILREARTARSSVIQAVKSRLDRFRKHLPAYRHNGEFALNRWWVETREEILSSPTAEKHYIPPGGPKTILRINRDPDMIRETDRAWLKSKQGNQGGAN